MLLELVVVLEEPSKPMHPTPARAMKQATHVFIRRVEIFRAARLWTKGTKMVVSCNRKAARSEGIVLRPTTCMAFPRNKYVPSSNPPCIDTRLHCEVVVVVVSWVSTTAFSGKVLLEKNGDAARIANALVAMA